MHTNIVKLYTEDKLSIREIQKITSWSIYKIRKTLLDAGVRLRDKSEAQKTALEVGRSSHPTEGKTLREETKAAIGCALVQYHKTKPESDKIKDSINKSERWKDRDQQELTEMRTKGLDKIRRTAKQGSALERFICTKLIEHSIPFIFHQKSPFGDTNLEVDIMLKNRKIAIEVDGPGHFYPVWGDDKLQDTKEFDSRKNGLLLGLGYTIIRVQHKKPGTRPSKTRMETAWQNTLEAINTKSGLVEVEV